MDQQKLQILLNPSAEWDAPKASYFDQITSYTFSSDPDKINRSNSLLQNLYDDANFWMNVDKIYNLCSHPRSKFYGFVMLENAIKIKWKSLPTNQKQGIRSFVGHVVMELGEKQIENTDMNDVLKKCNSCLVEILKYQWNTTWTNFIDQVCESSQHSMNICQNNLLILKLLSEEIFDFSKNQMTLQQITSLKEQMTNQFTNVFNLCQLVLNNSDNLKPLLIKTCLDTLHSFLSWIPIAFIYFSDIIDKLTFFINNEYYRSSALNCLIEVFNIPIDMTLDKASDIQMKLFESFCSCLKVFGNILNFDEDIPAHRRGKYRNNLQYFDMICKEIALVVTNMLREHGVWLFKATEASVQSAVRQAFRILLLLLTSPEEQCFKIIIEYFHHFLKVTLGLGEIEAASFGVEPSIPNIFQEFFVELRQIVVLKMVKPQEVLIVIDEAGIPVREDLANTENSSFYQLMIEVLVYMVRIDWYGLKNFIINKIETQMDPQEMKYQIVNSLSWAAGALSGHLPQHQDRQFLISILKILLKLCDSKKGKEAKAVLASCIMFIVGQYPDFLRSNWNFLKTVIKKLFEFMQETYEGVQQMACNTFLKICKSTQQCLLQQHEGDSEPYLYTLIRQMPMIIKHLLDIDLTMIFYESIIHVISRQTADSVKTIYMKQCLGHLLTQFLEIIQVADQNVTVIEEESYQKQISYFLRVNEIMAGVVGFSYGLVLFEFNGMINTIYQYYATRLNTLVQQNGPHVINHVVNKRMRNINKQILRLYRVYISACNDMNANKMNSIKQTFINSLETILKLFSESIPELKEPELISLFTVVFQKLNQVLTPDFVNVVIETVFSSVLNMITTDFSSYPEIRQVFFEFIRALIKFNFQQFYNMSGDRFQTSLNCVVWSFKHHLTSFSDLGLDLLEAILSSMNTNKNIANAFYQKYYINLMKDLLEVLTDGYHKSGMREQSRLLFILIQAVTSNYFYENLVEGQNVSNTEYVYQFLLNILSDTFSNVSKSDTVEILNGLFATGDEKQFKTILGDYLVMINRISSVEGQQMGQ